MLSLLTVQLSEAFASKFVHVRDPGPAITTMNYGEGEFVLPYGHHIACYCDTGDINGCPLPPEPTAKDCLKPVGPTPEPGGPTAPTEP